jgi:hypothetical protein
VRYEFKTSGELFEWRGPAPYYFVKVDPKTSALIKQRARQHSYGWGVVYIHGCIGKTAFQTTLIPKKEIYYIPIKDVLRKILDLRLDDVVKVQFNLGKMKD